MYAERKLGDGDWSGFWVADFIFHSEGGSKITHLRLDTGKRAEECWELKPPVWELDGLTEVWGFEWDEFLVKPPSTKITPTDGPSEALLEAFGLLEFKRTG